MRIRFLLAALAGLGACSPQIPDSAAGVGFDDYDQYEARQRSRAVAVPPAGAISAETIAPAPLSALAAAPAAPAAVPDATTATAATTTVATTAPPADSRELAAETAALLAATRANSGQRPLEASPDNPPPPTVTTSAGISAENDFEAVGAVRSISADAELLARNRRQYEVVAPTGLPSRSDSRPPNIVAYALKTRHPVGTKLYTRIGINRQARFERNCAAYPSPDLAQIDFLARGGPERDWLGLDPDGDGFACGWNPEPFRQAVSG